MKILKRIWNFDKEQWNLLMFFIKNLFKQLFIGIAVGNLSEFIDTWQWLKMHCCYDSKLKE